MNVLLGIAEERNPRELQKSETYFLHPFKGQLVLTHEHTSVPLPLRIMTKVFHFSKVQDFIAFRNPFRINSGDSELGKEKGLLAGFRFSFL